MLRWRLLLGTLIIGALGLLCWLDAHAARPGTWLFPVALVLAALSVVEMVGLLAHSQLRPLRGVAYGGTLLVVLANGVPLFWPDYPSDCPVGRLGWPVLALAAGLLLAFLGEMRRYEPLGGVAANLASALFPMIYVGLTLSFAVQLRSLGGSTIGLVALASLIAVVKMGDIGAYTVGRLIGRHKMAPALSPGKTWEGVAGAILFACLGSYLMLEVLLPAVQSGTPADARSAPAWGWILYGVALAIAGIVGDLAESLLKRDAGQKDSSTWLPGFGGVLDLLDSILAAAPVAYVLWVAQVVGPTTN